MENRESLLIGVTLLAAAAIFTAIAVIGKRHKASILRELGDALDDDDQMTEDSYTFILPDNYHENEIYQFARKATWDAGFINRERIKQILRLLTAQPSDGGSGGRGPTPEEVTRALLDNSLVLTQHGLPVVNPRGPAEEPQRESSSPRFYPSTEINYDQARRIWSSCEAYTLNTISEQNLEERYEGMIVIPKVFINRGRINYDRPDPNQTIGYAYFVVEHDEDDDYWLENIRTGQQVARSRSTLMNSFMEWKCTSTDT